MKRLFDFVIALLLIIFTLPVMGLIAILILVTMGRPIIFKQQRPGLEGKPFFIHKFRTMSLEQDEEGALLEDKYRLTWFGKLLRKLSLDELPQLFNVLRGDLSFVGPRPLLMEYLPLYSITQARRHEVPPGITGWAQVNGRNAVSWEDRFELDVWYVDHQSFYLDLKIIIMTMIKVMKREGVSQTGHATMSKFRGTKES